MEHDHGITPDGLIPSAVVTADSIQRGNLIEPSRLDSRLSSLADDLFEQDSGIKNPALIPSEPSGFGSRLSSSIGDSHELAFFGLDDEHGIHVVTEDSIPIDGNPP